MAAAPKPKAPQAKADRTTLYLLGGLAAAVVLVVVYLRSRGGGLSDTLAGAPSVRAGTPQTGGPVGGASQTSNPEPSQVGDGTDTTGQGTDFSGPHSQPFQPGGDNPPPGGGDNTGPGGPIGIEYKPAAVETFPNAGFYTLPHTYDSGTLSGPGGPVADYDVAPLPPKVITMTSPLPHPVGPLPGGPVVD